VQVLHNSRIGWVIMLRVTLVWISIKSIGGMTSDLWIGLFYTGIYDLNGNFDKLGSNQSGVKLCFEGLSLG
jgi:hypothetical protein